MKNRIAFWGDSLTKGGTWQEYFPTYEVFNFGRAGERSDEILFRLDAVLFWEPKKIFLMMGVNDLINSLSVQKVLSNYQKLFSLLKEHKQVELIVQNLLPTNESLFSCYFEGKKIVELNSQLSDLCEKEKITYVDLYTDFSTDSGQLITEYTIDGLHLNEAGYRVWHSCLQAKNLI